MAVWKNCPGGGSSPGSPALFLDRDGVVIVDRDYLGDPEQVELLPGAAETMAAGKAAGYLLIGVSNQSGLGRGRFSAADLGRVMTRLDKLLAAAGTGFDGFYYCPHAPGDGCSCRKPALGLLEEAARDCRWDPARSWIIGDKSSDVGFGRNGGLGAVLVRTGYGAVQETEVLRKWEADSRVLVADDLAGAFAAILARDGQEAGS